MRHLLQVSTLGDFHNYMHGRIASIQVRGEFFHENRCGEFKVFYEGDEFAPVQFACASGGKADATDSHIRFDSHVTLRFPRLDPGRYQVKFRPEGKQKWSNRKPMVIAGNNRLGADVCTPPSSPPGKVYFGFTQKNVTFSKRWSASRFADRDSYVKWHPGGEACYTMLGSASPVFKSGEMYVSVPAIDLRTIQDPEKRALIHAERTVVKAKGFRINGGGSYSFSGRDAMVRAEVINDYSGGELWFWETH